MRFIVIATKKDGTARVLGGKFQPIDFLQALIHALAFEVCRLKKPGATPDDLWVAASGALCTAIFEQHDDMYPQPQIPDRFEWEVI